MRDMRGFYLVIYVLMCSCSEACSQPHQSSPSQFQTPDGLPEAGHPTGPIDDPNVLWRQGDCAHPRVEKQCKDGWCSIPKGCFIIGSPEDEWGRGMYTENQVPVTFTRPFHIQQHEFTLGEWKALGLEPPTVNFDGNCTEPTCPLAGTNLYEAMFVANLVSEKRSLPACYKLDECVGNPGDGMVCMNVVLTTSTLYDCQGFRLPTEAEWEYAARAGTRTAYYNGGFAPETTHEMVVSCHEEKNLDPIAWNCNNSGDRIHPVGQKIPNNWGLHDIIGNVDEWTNDHAKYEGYGTVPLIDPEGQLVQATDRVVRGAGFTSWPAISRAAKHNMVPWGVRGPGLRLVRTGSENRSPKW